MNSLLPELKLDIFKCLNFGQVYSMRETNRYFRDFINYYEKELARVKFEKITIVPFCSVDDHLLYSLSAEDFVIEFGGYDFTLSNEKKEKWKSAIDKHFPLYLCSDKPKPIVQPIVHLQIKQVWAYYRDIVLKLPSIPKNIEEMCILRCWFERLFLCFYDEAKFENIVFNPQLIKLLFDNEENIFQKLHTKETYLIYPVHLFELQGMHFVRNHLTVSNNFKIDFFGLQKEENEECNKIIFNIWLNDSARFPYVSVVTSVTFQLFTLLIKYISSSSDSSAVVAQLECQVDWNFTGNMNNNIQPEVKLDIFKCLNFDQLFSIQQTNRYFRSFVNDYEKELARKQFKKISIVQDDCSVSNILFCKEIDPKVGVFEFSLKKDFKDKWQNAIDKSIPLYLSSNEFPDDVCIRFDKIYPTIENSIDRSANNSKASGSDSDFISSIILEDISTLFQNDLLLKLPSTPKNIEEMCIIRCWLERLSRSCAFIEAEFDHIIFNPELIKLLFENEETLPVHFYTKNAKLNYIFTNFELQGMEFVRNHLKISKTFKIDFTPFNNFEQCNDIILNIFLNEGARFQSILVISHMNFSFFKLVLNHIKTSNCSTLVSELKFKTRRYPENIHIGRVLKKCYDERRVLVVNNDNNKNVSFEVSRLFPKNTFNVALFNIKKIKK